MPTTPRTLRGPGRKTAGVEHVRLYRTRSFGTLVGTGAVPGPHDVLTRVADFSWKACNASGNPWDYVLDLVKHGFPLETDQVTGFAEAFDSDAQRKILGAQKKPRKVLLPPAWSPWTRIRCVGCSHLTSANERTRLHGVGAGAHETAVAPTTAMPSPKLEPYKFVRRYRRCECFSKGPFGTKGMFVGTGDYCGILPGGQNVVETEYMMWINAARKIAGFTMGNDATGHWIEALCTLFLTQAKEFWGCCGFGPCLVLLRKPIALDDPATVMPAETPISLVVSDRSRTKVQGSAKFGDFARSAQFYCDWGTRYQDLSNGLYLMMGTGVMHPPGVGLDEDDLIVIESPQVGKLILGGTMLQEYPGVYEDLTYEA